MKEMEIFVITPIGQKGTDLYKKYDAIFKTMIEPAAKSADTNFKVTRADHVAKPGSFVKDILGRLKNSFIVIANLTDLNPNVFYELGVRHALSNRTIIITEELSKVPSDLKEYRAIEYTPDITGVEEFKTSLTKSINEIMKDREHPDNPVQDRLGEIIKSREDELLKEIETMRKRGTEKRVGQTSTTSESIDRRIDRILKLWGAERGHIVKTEWQTFDDNNKKISHYIYPPDGNFNYYFLNDETDNEYCLVISRHNTKFDINIDLADIRVMLTTYNKVKDAPFRFIIASNDNLTKEKSKAISFFENALKTAKIKESKKFAFEIWDDVELGKIELKLGLRI